MVDPILLGMLVCTECRRSLKEDGEHLICTSCGRQFEVRDGIPILFPRDVDQTHLAEEEHLAHHKTGDPTPTQRFRLD
ncbi:MAG TPA: Trm112 family protein [Armatimonadota bacterium]|nr:Trm112 family protein [Armatimonadota bacterium]